MCVISEKFSDYLCFTTRNLYLVAIVATVTIFLTNGEAAVPTGCSGINGRLTTQLADQSSCNRFYKCNMGKKILIECPYYKDEVTSFQLCFNSELGLCDWPWNVTCCNDFVPGNGTVPTVTPPNKPCTPGQKRPYKGKCDLYYLCIDGEEKVTSCQRDQYFNPNTKKCDTADNVPNCP